MLLPHRCQHSTYKLLEILGSDTQLLLGWSEGLENAREPESQSYWTPHSYKVTRALLQNPLQHRSSAGAFGSPLPEGWEPPGQNRVETAEIQYVLEERRAGR